MLGDEDEDDGRLSKKHKQQPKLIENEELAWKQGEKLENAKRAVIEMEGVSLGVMRDLDRQTGQLRNINSKVGDMNQELDFSKSILGRIMKRENRNKIIIGVVVVIIGLIFILILYFTIAPSSTNSFSSNSFLSNITDLAKSNSHITNFINTNKTINISITNGNGGT